MKIIVDIMGSDKGPAELMAGVIEASREYDIDIAAVGDEETIVTALLGAGDTRIEAIPTEQIITMEDEPLSVVREKNESSMSVGLKMLREGKGDAFVSAGNTGALHAGSTLIVRRIKGVQKSVIATVLPYRKPMLLIDSGANLEVKPETMLQFAEMGSVYMSKQFGIESPEVALLNIGSERTKGHKYLVEAYGMLEGAQDINFIGNLEGRDLPYGRCDVLVTDGFTGNIVLKLTEGCGSYIMECLKGVFAKNALTTVSALPVKKGLMKMKSDFDATEYGGAPLLGLSRPVIKAHGSSNARAMKHAIRQAAAYASADIIYEIALRLSPGMSEVEGKREDSDE